MSEDKIAREVLEVYRKESPSAISIEEDEAFKRFYNGMRNLWQDKLKLPLGIFRGAQVSDFGCGTGEVDVFLALQGCRIKGVDFNPDSITRAVKLANNFDLKQATFLQGDLHDAGLFDQGISDFAISLGVLPHVSHPETVFDNMVHSCRDEAFLVLGFVEEMGIVQRLLHRSIVRALAGHDEDKIVEMAKQAFGDHIRRSVKYGQRSERSVIYDYLVNRHMRGLPLEMVLNWFSSNRIKFYSSWPSIDLPLRISPYTTPELSIMHPFWKEYRAWLRLRWMFSQLEDHDVFSGLNEKVTLNEIGIYEKVDRLGELISILVQDQDQVWEEGCMSSVARLGQAIPVELHRIIQDLNDQVLKQMLESFAALEKVIDNIFKMQKRDIDVFEPITGLFRELNGLGTLYLCGQLQRKTKQLEV